MITLYTGSDVRILMTEHAFTEDMLVKILEKIKEITKRSVHENIRYDNNFNHGKFEEGKRFYFDFGLGNTVIEDNEVAKKIIKEVSEIVDTSITVSVCVEGCIVKEIRYRPGEGITVENFKFENPFGLIEVYTKDNLPDKYKHLLEEENSWFWKIIKTKKNILKNPRH